MRVERHVRHAETDNEGRRLLHGYDWREWEFDVDGRLYSAELRRGSGATIRNAPDARRGDIEAIAERLMAEDGVRFVFYEDEILRPPPRLEPRALREDEAALLYHLLDVDDQRLEPLRQQVPYALVRDDSLLPFRLDLTVAEGLAPPATAVYRNPTVEASTICEDENMLTVMLWIQGDYLGQIEVIWYQSEPERLPYPTELNPAKLCGV